MARRAAGLCTTRRKKGVAASGVDQPQLARMSISVAGSMAASKRGKVKQMYHVLHFSRYIFAARARDGRSGRKKIYACLHIYVVALAYHGVAILELRAHSGVYLCMQSSWRVTVDDLALSG